MAERLRDLPVLVVDCQTTGASPGRGHLLEVGWAEVRGGRAGPVHSFTVRLPEGEGVPARITALTGMDDGAAAGGLPPTEVRSLLLAAVSGRVPVAHCARFEQRWLDHLASDGGNRGFPEMLCTMELARRLMPGLPGKGLRAVAGRLGHPTPPERRAAHHVLATAAVWPALVRMLEERGLDDLDRLRALLAEPPPPRGETLPDHALPREERLALPDSPGVYRMLDAAGRVLYVGRASSLRRRVNAYFTRRKGRPSTMEMVSQVHGLSVSACETRLETALLEMDAIREHDPPYNVALRERGRELGYLSPDLSSETGGEPPPVGPGGVGPFHEDSPALLLPELRRLLSGEGADPERLRLPPERLEEGALEEGRRALAGRLRSPPTPGDLLAAGAALWRERAGEGAGKGDDEGGDSPADDPAAGEALDAGWVEERLARLLADAARQVRMAAWTDLLADSSVSWTVRGGRVRRLTLHRGAVVRAAWEEPGAGSAGPPAEGAGRLTEGRLTRVRLLTSELRRLVAAGATVTVTLPTGRELGGERLERLFSMI